MGITILEEEFLLDASLDATLEEFLLFLSKDVTSMEVTTIEDSLLSSLDNNTIEDSSLLVVYPLISPMTNPALSTPSSLPQDTLKTTLSLSSPSENCIPTL